MSNQKSWLGELNGYPVRFVTHFRHWRSGKVIYAKDYGKKAFAIPLKRKK